MLTCFASLVMQMETYTRQEGYPSRKEGDVEPNTQLDGGDVHVGRFKVPLLFFIVILGETRHDVLEGEMRLGFVILVFLRNNSQGDNATSGLNIGRGCKPSMGK